MIHVMVDLETLDTIASATILSIGAVKFDLEGKIWETFYSGPISRRSCSAFGLTVDDTTLEWWQTQDEDVKSILAESLVSNLGIVEALENFSDFFPYKQAYLWGNGADFDNAILTYVYRITGQPIPWNHQHNRCYRTIKSLTKIPKPELTGVKHNALDDAINQSRHLIQILRGYGI